MAMTECPKCGQLIENRGMKKHLGSKKCQIAADKRKKDDTTETSCPDCGQDLKILSSNTIIKLEDGRYVPKEQIQEALDMGETMYCMRCLKTSH